MRAIACAVALLSVSPELVWVDGGVFRNAKSNYFGKRSVPSVPFAPRPVAVRGFYIGRCEVTQREWTAVMGTNPSQTKGGTLPVDTVSWYDCIEYCDRRSEREGLPVCYRVDRAHPDAANGNAIDDVKWTVTLIPGARGYRLPTEAEWEYAAGGGKMSKGYAYSGGDDVDNVAWYYRNSGDRVLAGFWSWPVIQQNHNRSRPVGSKPPNELGLVDMSGNVREWCWNYYSEAPAIGTGPAEGTAGRVWRGGGWMGGDFCCATAFRGAFEASGKGPDQGFRICRGP